MRTDIPLVLQRALAGRRALHLARVQGPVRFGEVRRWWEPGETGGRRTPLGAGLTGGVVMLGIVAWIAWRSWRDVLAAPSQAQLLVTLLFLLFAATGAFFVVRDLRAMAHVDDWIAVCAEDLVLVRRERATIVPYSALEGAPRMLHDGALELTLRRKDGTKEAFRFERVDTPEALVATIAARLAKEAPPEAAESGSARI